MKDTYSTNLVYTNKIDTNEELIIYLIICQFKNTLIIF